MKVIVLVILLTFQLPTIDSSRQLGRKGYLLEGKQILGDSEVAYKRALKVDHSLAEVRFNLGNTLYKQKRYKEAIAQYERLISDSGANEQLAARAHYNKGTTLLKMNRLLEGEEAFQESLRLNPDNTLAKYNLAYILNMLKQEKNHLNEKEDDSGATEGNEGETRKNNAAAGQIGGAEDANAEDILQILDMHERRLHEKIKRNYRSAKRLQIEKDW